MDKRFPLDLSREELEEIVNGLSWAEHESGERDEKLCRDLRARLGGMLAE